MKKIFNTLGAAILGAALLAHSPTLSRGSPATEDVLPQSTCETTPASLVSDLKESGRIPVVLSGDDLDVFDEAIQSMGGPAKPASVTDLVMIDPRVVPQNQVQIAVFVDGCFDGLTQFPTGAVIRALKAVGDAV